MAARRRNGGHQHFDGGGYPRGLVGEEIPLAGRIVAVADAFDALVTDRAHRRAGSIADAEMVLHAGRGQQFDPWIVDTFLAARDDVLLALRRFPAAERLNPDDYVSVRTAASVLSIPRPGCAAGPTKAGSR